MLVYNQIRRKTFYFLLLYVLSLAYACYWCTRWEDQHALMFDHCVCIGLKGYGWGRIPVADSQCMKRKVGVGDNQRT